MKTHIRIIFPLILFTGLVCTSETFAVKHVVHVGNFQFNPSTQNVSVGDTIRWQWDNGSHTTTSLVIPPGADSWNSPLNSSSQIFEYRITVSGVYNYKCTPHSAMGMVASFTASAATGIVEQKDINISVFPNPSGGIFKIVLGNTFEKESEISLIDISGKTILKRTTNGSGEITFDLSGSPKGYYFVRLSSAGGTIVRRIIID
jgi:plastocyanin